MHRFIQIQWTSAHLEEARRIAKELVQQKSVACATIIPHVESIFSWKGAIDTAQEVKVLLKTQKEKFQEVKDYIQKHCSYEVPEILGILIDEGNQPYLEWVAQETQ